MKNAWQKARKRSGWIGNGLVEWLEGNTAYLSVVFSWNLPSAYQRAVWLRQQGFNIIAGGPAVRLNPSYLSQVATIGNEVPALLHHNPNATFTSRGCIRKCSFCAVPKIEGDLKELSDWEPRQIVCDNNLLACSKKHFDSVIDRLKPLRQVDFNQGLDARLLTKHHADRFTELNLRCIRLAFDHVRIESRFLAAFSKLTDAGIRPSAIRVYVLIGFDDTPEDALYRLEYVRGLGAWPNPMRYQPLDATRRNKYVRAGWTNSELTRYMRYWSNLRFTNSIPFSEFDKSARVVVDDRQMSLI